MGKLTTKDFIEKSIKVHGDRYDYSESKYTNNITPIKIICLEHGVFEQTPHNHKRGSGCKKCTAGAPALSLEEFIVKATKVHNNIYNYSQVNYKNNRTKIDIICSEHGMFEQSPGGHLMGQGCPTCNVGNIKISEVRRRIKNTHGDRYTYDFSSYNGVDDKINITCNTHGSFKQRASDHIKGHGCHECSGSVKLTTEMFIKNSIGTHGDKYDYSLVEYKDNKTKVNIICNKHGGFTQSPNSHSRGAGCPFCKESKGERAVEQILKEKGIRFIRQHKFNDCKDKRCLPFDFYLPDDNMCIEFNGRQHYEPVATFGGEKSLKGTQRRDKIKEGYCNKNNIPLLAIKYDENISLRLDIF